MIHEHYTGVIKKNVEKSTSNIQVHVNYAEVGKTSNEFLDKKTNYTVVSATEPQRSCILALTCFLVTMKLDLTEVVQYNIKEIYEYFKRYNANRMIYHQALKIKADQCCNTTKI